MGDTGTRERIPKLRLIKYAAASIGGGMTDFPLSVFLLPFYTEIVGLDLATVGLIALIIGLYDAVTDPGMGILSDRLQKRFGCRKVTLLWGAIPLGISFYWLFNPIEGYESLGFFVAYLVFITAMDMVFIPHMAIGSEMSFDYHERMRVQSFARGFWIIGLLLGIFIPIGLTSNISDKASGYANMSLIMGISMTVTVFITYIFTKEGTNLKSTHSIPITKQFTTTFKNKHFIVLFLGYIFYNFAVAVQNAVFVYYSINWLEVPETKAMLAIPIYIFAAILSVPIWQKLSEKIIKRNLLVFALFCNVVTSSLIFFIPRGEVFMLYGIFFLAGISYGCTMVIPNAIISDVIDYDEYLSGEYRAGAYFGIWEFGRKASYNFSVWLSMQLLYVIGYIQQADQTLFVDNSIRIMISFLSGGFYLISAIVFIFFKFNKKETQEIQKLIGNQRKVHVS
ncbi:MAG: hypothetical protein A4E56_01474 [Pelotomaculum sp. PtaU1.Bin065]|nr:MAG: hypothetical protein A4E56_01474 [Pelotomaculum sp. PtaU1.Bin065]